MRIETVDLPQGHLAFVTGLPPPPPNLMQLLYQEIEWDQPVYDYGRGPVPQPRLSCWMGEPEAVYGYSGRRYNPRPWHPMVRTLAGQISTAVEDLLPGGFNGCLLNYYRDHRDSVSFHADDELELGRDPVIAALSLGAPREIHFKSAYDEHPKVKLLLPPDSWMLMWGRTQRMWKHSVPKQRRPCGPRLSLTFRRIYSRGKLGAQRGA